MPLKNDDFLSKNGHSFCNSRYHHHQLALQSSLFSSMRPALAFWLTGSRGSDEGMQIAIEMPFPPEPFG